MAERLRVVIIDDEAPARGIIRSYLKDYPDIEMVAECSNGFEGLKAINEFSPDLMFLDIQMPKISGFELLELLEKTPVTVFCTAYDQYALQAFQANAADYLLKPFSKERFREALNRALIFIKDRSQHQTILKGVVNHRDGSMETLERIVVKTGSSAISIVPVKIVLWLEAQDDYVMIHTKEGGLLKQKTMKYFETHLDPKEFVRIHRSYIVRIAMIKQVELFRRESYKVLLINGKRLPVSKSGHNRLKQILEG